MHDDDRGTRRALARRRVTVEPERALDDVEGDVPLHAHPRHPLADESGDEGERRTLHRQVAAERVSKLPVRLSDHARRACKRERREHDRDRRRSKRSRCDDRARPDTRGRDSCRQETEHDEPRGHLCRGEADKRKGCVRHHDVDGHGEQEEDDSEREAGVLDHATRHPLTSARYVSWPRLGSPGVPDPTGCPAGR